MEYVSIIVKFIISILTSLFIYYLLKTKGFKWALIINIIMQFIIILIENKIPSIINNNFLLLITFIILGIIIQVILTGVQFFAYRGTNSFISYFIVSKALWTVVSVILYVVLKNILKGIFYMLL